MQQQQKKDVIKFVRDNYMCKNSFIFSMTYYE